MKNSRVSLLTYVAVILTFVLGYGLGNGNIKRNINAVKTGIDAAKVQGLDYAQVQDVYQALADNFDGDLDSNKMLEGAKKGLVSAAGDQYTVYFDAEESKSFQEQLDGEFEGIGAELDQKNGLIEVVAPITGFPAEKAGVLAGDIILKVDEATTENKTVSEVVKLIRGPKGTSVSLQIAREGEPEPIIIAITRETISLPSVTWKIDETRNVGIMTVSRFSSDTKSLSEKAASEFVQKGVVGVVLDMRNNPGGELGASVDLSSLWLDKDDIVLTERKNGVIKKQYKSSQRGALFGIKSVVLINAGSASASEITAGALKDNAKATILGVKSYGKGSVQQLIELNDGLLKVTIDRWFTPAGKNIDKEGISPDKEIKRPAGEKSPADSQLDAALLELVQ
jgi:carboxyl-terminal processing protease